MSENFVRFSIQFLKCNLVIGRKSYGLENTEISHGTGISRAVGNSCNSGIPRAQTLPSHFPGIGNFQGISHLWFPVEHPMVCLSSQDLTPWSFPQELIEQWAWWGTDLPNGRHATGSTTFFTHTQSITEHNQESRSPKSWQQTLKVQPATDLGHSKGGP